MNKPISEVDFDSLTDVAAYIHSWANRTFPGRSPDAALTKLVLEEIPEMLAHKRAHGLSGIGTELADAFILLLDLAILWNVDLSTAIRDKMQINERRMWTKDAATGTWNHADLKPGRVEEKLCMSTYFSFEQGARLRCTKTRGHEGKCIMEPSRTLE